MRPVVRTRRQARQRFQAALNYLNDLWKVRNVIGPRGQQLVPDESLVGLSIARSGIKQALGGYSTRNDNGNSADAGK